MTKEMKELLTIEDLNQEEERLFRITCSLDLQYIKKIIPVIDGYILIIGPDSIQDLELFFCKRNCELFDYLDK